MLLKNLHKYDIQKIEKQVKIINRISKETYDFLNELLLWTKSQSGKLIFDYQDIEFTELISNVIKRFQIKTDEKNIRIVLDANITINTDANFLKTIMRNLISNAIKFSHHGGQINVYAKKNNTESIITVSDKGIGIEKDAISKIWSFHDNFSTNGTNNEQGTGFGLTLCKELIEKQGGKIWIESKVGKGSDFKFTLPFKDVCD